MLGEYKNSTSFYSTQSGLNTALGGEDEVRRWGCDYSGRGSSIFRATNGEIFRANLTLLSSSRLWKSNGFQQRSKHWGWCYEMRRDRFATLWATRCRSENSLKTVISWNSSRPSISIRWSRWAWPAMPSMDNWQMRRNKEKEMRRRTTLRLFNWTLRISSSRKEHQLLRMS